MTSVTSADGLVLSPRDFARIAELVEAEVGIKLPPNKRTMVEGRLRRRARVLGLPGVADYCAFFFDERNLTTEFPHLIDAVTTNKTDFFREPTHFEFLRRDGVPTLMQELGAGQHRPLRVWSAACSTGAEPYTIAMVLADIALQSSALRFEIFASDISSEVLATAVQAIYPEEFVDPVPLILRQRYLLRSRNASPPQVRITPELRRLVKFAQHNLMSERAPWSESVDVVFCRNVLIYFSKETQGRVMENICRHLISGGLLFVGHSETLAGLSLPVVPVAPSVYRRL